MRKHINFQNVREIISLKSRLAPHTSSSIMRMMIKDGKIFGALSIRRLIPCLGLFYYACVLCMLRSQRAKNSFLLIYLIARYINHEPHRPSEDRSKHTSECMQTLYLTLIVGDMHIFHNASAYPF